MSTTTAEDTLATGAKSIVVIFTEQQWRAAETHVNSLEKDGEVDHRCCNDIEEFGTVDTDKYRRLDILVDTHMCTILMIGEELHERAKAKFKAIDKKRGKIYLINRFAQDFDTLFYRLPVNVRKVIEHGGAVPQRENGTSSIGMTGYSQSTGGIVCGEVDGRQNNLIVNIINPFGSFVGQKQGDELHLKNIESTKSSDTANNGSEKVDMKVYVPKPKDEATLSKTIENKGNIKEKAKGVEEIEICPGCVLLTLTLTKGQVITEEWVQDVLHMLYDEVLSFCLSEGEKFDVDVQRRVQYNFVIPPDPKLHENCISQIEHEKQLQELIDQQKEKNAQTSDLVASSVSTVSSDYISDEEVEQFSSGGCVEGFMDSSTKNCKLCTEVGRKYRSLVHGEDVCVVHVPINIISCSSLQKKERLKGREKRREFLQEIRIYATSLLNTCGGKILIHLHGNIHEDRNLEVFDKTVMMSFERILGESQLYTNTYSRDWLCNTNATLSNHDFVQVSVNKSESVVTADFNTKISTDCEIKSPSSFLIKSIMSQPVRETRRATIMGLSDNMHENRSKVFKSYRTTDENHTEVRVFVDYIWTNLRLKEYITSMSKITDGGSFFLGITEGHKEAGIYRTKENRVDAFVMPCGKHEFRVALFEKLKNDMCVLDKATMTFLDVPSDLIDVAFHTVSDNRVVLEVAIGYFDGIVFSDRLGPRTYTMRKGLICRMHKQKWLKRIRKFPVFTF